MKNNKSKEEKGRLMKTIFKYINQVPDYEIKHSVVLVSYSEDSSFAFRKITGNDRNANDKHPLLFKLKDNSRLIDPSIAFLRPEIETNFICMHYIMNLVQEAKFIFVFNHQDTSVIPFDNIKKTLTKFISMFKSLNQWELEKLVASCGILIVDARTGFDASVYSERLVGNNDDSNLLEESYLGKEYNSVKTLVKGIVRRKQMLLFSPSLQGKAVCNQFTDFVGGLSFFELSNQVDLKLESTYQEFVGCQIQKIWHEIFDLIYNSLDSIVINQGSQLFSEDLLYNQIREYSKKSNEEKVDKPKHSFKSIKLLNFIHAMIQIIMKFINNEIEIMNTQHNRLILAEFLDILYSSAFLKIEFLREFLMSFFLIRKFLSKTGDDLDNPDKDLFHRVSFCEIIGNTDVFNLKIRQITVELLSELERDMKSNVKTYPYDECLILLENVLIFKDEQKFTFFTERITKKMIKFQAHAAYNLIQLNQKDRRARLKHEFDFIKIVSASKSIKTKEKVEVLTSIALELAERQETTSLSLEIFKMLPQYQVYKHVRFIYESKLKLNTEVLEYLPSDQRKQLLEQHFEAYYTFLLRIGFQEPVRQLSMECLRLAQTEEERQYFKNALIKARGNSFRDLHNSFLEDSIIQEKEVAISEQFINHLQDELRGQELI